MVVAEAQNHDVKLNGLAIIPLNSSGEAIGIIEDMKSELDNAFVGEDAAKYALIGTLALHSNLALGGKAGTGKSSMARASARLIGLDYDRDVAFVPGSPDLRATDVIGGNIHQEKTVVVNTENGTDERQEIITNRVQGAFNADTIMGHFEELTAADLRALRASMSIFGDRTLETNAGVIRLRKFIAAIASMNIAKRSDGTQKPPNQMMDRMTFGAYVGETAKTKDARIKHNMEVEEKGEHPEVNISQVVEIPKLKQLGAYMLKKVRISEPARGKMHELIVATANYLAEEHDIVESDHRMIHQMRKNALAFGARNEQQYVRDEDLFDATRSIIASRIAPIPTAEDLNLDADVKRITKF